MSIKALYYHHDISFSVGTMSRPVSRMFCHFNFNSLTAGAAYIRVFICYYHIKYHILNMLKIKCDINQKDLKRLDLHFVKSE